MDIVLRTVDNVSQFQQVHEYLGFMYSSFFSICSTRKHILVYVTRFHVLNVYSFITNIRV